MKEVMILTNYFEKLAQKFYEMLDWLLESMKFGDEDEED